MRIGVLVGIAVLWGVPGPVAAQDEMSPPLVRPGTDLRIRLADSTTLSGRLVSREARTILLERLLPLSGDRARRVRTTVPLDSISSAWFRSGTRWTLGAGAGSGVGAVGMLLVANMASNQDGSSCDAWCYTSAGTVGAVAGALIGALVGYRVTVWRPVRF